MRRFDPKWASFPFDENSVLYLRIDGTSAICSYVLKTTPLFRKRLRPRIHRHHHIVPALLGASIVTIAVVPALLGASIVTIASSISDAVLQM